MKREKIEFPPFLASSWDVRCLTTVFRIKDSSNCQHKGCIKFFDALPFAELTSTSRP